MSAELLETAATALGPLLDEVVFLGGASIHLWLSDPAAPATRATDDVDVISAITTPSVSAYASTGSARPATRTSSAAGATKTQAFSLT